MHCFVCYKKIEKEEDLCTSCKEFFEMQYPDTEERDRVLEWFKQNAGPNLS